MKIVADREQSMKKRGLNLVELTRFREQSVELDGYLDDTYIYELSNWVDRFALNKIGDTKTKICR